MPQFDHFIPLFNSSKIDELLSKPDLDKDDQGLFRPLETWLFPKSDIQIIDTKKKVTQIRTPLYNSDKTFYTLTSFTTNLGTELLQSYLFNKVLILENLRKYRGVPYVWGGSWVFDDFYKQVIKRQFKKAFWPHLDYIMSGLDCSGLLYASTYGYTPRNTSMLLDFGQEVLIEGLSPELILQNCLPLDLIVWKGHVLIVLDQYKLIESVNPKGVIEVDALERLKEIHRTRQPRNTYEADSYVIRRWISH